MTTCFRFIAVALIVLTPTISQCKTLHGRVVSVADGDTVTVLDESNEQHKIRLAGIDAPEKKQPFGERSKQSMARMVFSKTVNVEWTKLDRYGRIIGKIMVAQENCHTDSCPLVMDAGLAQITSGLAWHYKKYQREQLERDRTIYAQAEIDARSRQVGLWSEANPTAPWDYRHRK